MIGYKLTQQQRDLLVNKEFANDQKFNPVQDINGDWFIFQGEVNGHIEHHEYDWVTSLPTAEYVPPITTLPI